MWYSMVFCVVVLYLWYRMVRYGIVCHMVSYVDHQTILSYFTIGLPHNRHGTARSWKDENATNNTNDRNRRLGINVGKLGRFRERI